MPWFLVGAFLVGCLHIGDAIGILFEGSKALSADIVVMNPTGIAPERHS